MKTVRHVKLLNTFYIGVLITLLLSVIAMPVIIQHGLAVTRTFIIEEELLELSLIVVLFGVSYFMLKGFKRTLENREILEDRHVEGMRKISSRQKILTS